MNHQAASRWGRAGLGATLALVALGSWIFFVPGPAGAAPAELTARLGGELQLELDRFDALLAQAAKQLAVTGLGGAKADRVLAELESDRPYLILAASLNPQGRIVAVEPAPYRPLAGQDLSRLDGVKRALASRRPTLGQADRSLLGVTAVELVQPVKDGQGRLTGLALLLLHPESLLAKYLGFLKDRPEDGWVMEPRGRILYDLDPEEIDRNVFTDPIYQPFPDLLAQARKVAAQSQGSGSYSFRRLDQSLPQPRSCHWTSLGLHGTAWRLVIIQVGDPGSPGQAKRTPDDLGLPKLDQVLAELAQDPQFLKALEAGDEAAALARLRAIQRANPGLPPLALVRRSNAGEFLYRDAGGGRNQLLPLLKPGGQEGSWPQAVQAEKASVLTQALADGALGSFTFQPLRSNTRWLGAVVGVRYQF